MEWGVGLVCERCCGLLLFLRCARIARMVLHPYSCYCFLAANLISGEIQLFRVISF